MGVCFQKLGVWIKEFAFENGSMFWKMEVCFWESEFENGSLFSKIGVENQNLLPKSEFDVGAYLATVAWALVPDWAEESMFRHWRNGGQCWSKDDKKTTFLNLTQNQVKDLQETLCKRRKKRRKTERGTTCPPFTKNTNHRITKEIRTENAATVKHLQYIARANEALKTDIKKIRKTTEQELVNYVLTLSPGTMKGESLNAKEHSRCKIKKLWARNQRN